MSLLCFNREFPTSGIIVEDQGYVVRTKPIKIGYYEAAAPKVDSPSLECYVHSEEDIPKDEEDTDIPGVNPDDPLQPDNGDDPIDWTEIFNGIFG